MNTFIGSAEVAGVATEINLTGRLRYIFALKFDNSFVDRDGVAQVREGIMQAIGTPRDQHIPRWAAIEEGDIVYINGSLTPDLHGDIYLRIKDLGLKWEE